MKCNRNDCNLTALWQVSVDLQPVWDRSIAPNKVWFGLCVCGMCKDDVKITDLEDTIDKICNALTHGHPDMLEKNLEFLDISDGYWFNPGTATREVAPS